VFALIGGSARVVPPWTRLGIHEVGIAPERRASLRDTAINDAKRVSHAHLLEYAPAMGVDKALLAAAFAVPNETMRFLERDELARFGIDRREFGETPWYFTEKPPVATSKRLFWHTGTGDQARYRKGLVRLDCGARGAIRFLFAQEEGSFEQKSTGPLQF